MKIQDVAAILVCVIVFFLTGCLSPTQTVVQRYDEQGNLIETTTSSESVVKSVSLATTDKLVILWNSGWMFDLSASAATVENPTPTVKIGGGNIKNGYLSVPANAVDWDGVSSVLAAAGQDVTFDATGAKSETP